jgi:hypothetical protein
MAREDDQGIKSQKLLESEVPTKKGISMTSRHVYGDVVIAYMWNPM